MVSLLSARPLFDRIVPLQKYSFKPRVYTTALIENHLLGCSTSRAVLIEGHLLAGEAVLRDRFVLSRSLLDYRVI